MNPRSRSAKLMLVLVLGFLLGPFIVVFVAGFSAEESLRFPPQQYSLRWLAHVFTVEAFQRSFVTSLVVALGRLRWRWLSACRWLMPYRAFVSPAPKSCAACSRCR